MYCDTLTSGLSCTCTIVHVHVHVYCISLHVGVTRKHEFGRSSTSKKGLVRKASFNTRPYLHQYEIQGTCTVHTLYMYMYMYVYIHSTCTCNTFIHVHGIETN